MSPFYPTSIISVLLPVRQPVDGIWSPMHVTYQINTSAGKTQSRAIQRQTSYVLPIRVREKLGNTISIRNTVRKQRLCPPQSRAIQRQTSEVGALQCRTKYELIEQRMRQ